MKRGGLQMNAFCLLMELARWGSVTSGGTSSSLCCFALLTWQRISMIWYYVGRMLTKLIRQLLSWNGILQYNCASTLLQFSFVFILLGFFPLPLVFLWFQKRSLPDSIFKLNFKMSNMLLFQKIYFKLTFLKFILLNLVSNIK